MPKILYCWRCKMDIPMLTESEWEIVHDHLANPARPALLYRLRGAEADKRLRHAKALEAYKQITGFHETNANALWHHHLSLYGPPCDVCGKPLRTPRANWCAACGATRDRA